MTIFTLATLRVQMVRRWFLTVLAVLGSIGWMTPVRAQVSGYAFSSSTSTYTSFTGTPVVVNSGGGSQDDGYSTPLPLPFAVRFGTNVYSDITLSSNGYIGFGTHSTTNNYHALKGPENELVAFCSVNLAPSTNPTVYETTTVGTTPSRIFKLQAANFCRSGNPAKSGNAQVWFYEGSGIIEIRYGTFGTGWGSPVRDSVRVGLRAGAGNVTAVGNSWATPQKFTQARYGMPLMSSQGQLPINGQVFRFTPPAAAPVADFTASTTTATTSSLVTLTDQSLGVPTRWQWAFAPNTVQYVNNTNSQSRNPQVRFTATGCYTVTLTASNPSGSDSEVKTSYICVTAPTCFNNLHVGNCADSYMYQVFIQNTTLGVFNTGCAPGSYTAWPGTGNTTATLLAGQTYQLGIKSTGTLGNITGWLDSNGNGILEPSEFFVYPQLARTIPLLVPTTATAGLVRLRLRKSVTNLTASDACTTIIGETEDFLVTIVNPCNVPTPTIVTNSPLCAGGTINLSATGVPTGAGYSWSGPNGFSASTPSVSIPGATTSQSGTYSLVLTVSGCQSAAATASVAVYPVITPFTDSTSRCGPGSVTLTAFGPPGFSGYTFRWYTQATGSTPIAGITTGTYNTPVLAATRTYYVSLVMPTALGGCEGPRVPIKAIIRPLPNATLTPVGSPTVCAGDTVILRAGPRGRFPNGAPLYRYTYYLNGQSITTSSPDSLLVTNSGSYQVEVLSFQTGCSALSTAVAVTVEPVLSASFLYSDRTYCQNTVPAPVPTITGTPGGTFRVLPTTGLVINPTTGQLQVSTATPGTYAITA